MDTELTLVDDSSSIDTTPIVALRDLPLDQLAAEIKREHEATEYNLRHSLMHARSAGVRLIEVKRRLPYGEWTKWVKTHCSFSHRTVNLYVRIAKRWDTLVNSQPVANLTLRQASDLLQIDPSEEDAEATAHLINMNLLSWADLEGLEPLEVRALVKEVHEYYEDLCSEPDEDLAAKRAALPEEWNPPVILNRQAIHTDAVRVVMALRKGEIGKGNVRRQLRRLEMVVRKAKVKDTTPNGEGGEKKAATKNTPLIVTHVSPFEAYESRARTFIADTRCLLTEPHGLLNERVNLGHYQRVRLIKLVADVREALDELEDQAAAELEDQAAAEAVTDTIVPTVPHLEVMT